MCRLGTRAAGQLKATGRPPRIERHLSGGCCILGKSVKRASQVHVSIGERLWSLLSVGYEFARVSGSERAIENGACRQQPRDRIVLHSRTQRILDVTVVIVDVAGAVLVVCREAAEA